MKLFLLILIVTGIVLFFVYGKGEWIARFSEWSLQHRVEGAFVLAAIYSVAAVCLIPAALLTIVAGFILGLPVGCCAVILGATLGSCLAFLNGRFLFKEMVDEYLVKRYPQIQALTRVIRKNQFKVVLLLRLSPIVPYNALNYCLGLMPLDFLPYILGSFLGMMPGTLLYVYIGSTAASISDVASGNMKQTPEQQVLFWVGLALTILLTVAVTYLARRELRKELDGDAAAETSEDVEAAPGRGAYTQVEENGLSNSLSGNAGLGAHGLEGLELPPQGRVEDRMDNQRFQLP